MPAEPQLGTTASFLRELRATGTPVISITGAGDLRHSLNLIELDAADPGVVRALLREWHEEALLDLPGPSLIFDEKAALWGATHLLRAAWFYLDRESEPSEIERLLLSPPSIPMDAAAIFSADLALRYLPDIHRLAKTLAPGDPLTEALQNFAWKMPFSAVGIPPSDIADFNPDETSCSVIRSHSGLFGIFIDRIIQTNSSWWLDQPGIRDGIQTALGVYSRELAPSLNLSPSNSPLLT